MSKLRSVGFKVIGTLLHRVGVLALISRCVDCVQKKSVRKEHLHFPRIQKRLSRPVQILIYHGIDDAWSPFLGPSPIRGFKNHLGYLATYCNVLDLEEAVERIKMRDVPHRAVVITLDDGYRDSYVNAFPLLKEMGIPCSSSLFFRRARFPIRSFPRNFQYASNVSISEILGTVI